jgi:hypothetical protein
MLSVPFGMYLPEISELQLGLEDGAIIASGKSVRAS